MLVHVQKKGPDSEAWTGVCHTGKEQSPIDIKPATINLLAKRGSITFNDNYKKGVSSAFITNNGHTGKIMTQIISLSSNSPLITFKFR